MARKMPEGLRKYLEKKGKLKSEEDSDEEDKVQNRREALAKSKKAKSKLEQEKKSISQKKDKSQFLNYHRISWLTYRAFDNDLTKS